MSQTQEAKHRAGRPSKSPEGPRHILHISISPEAHKALETLCVREIAPIPASTMIEHLILTAAKAAG